MVPLTTRSDSEKEIMTVDSLLTPAANALGHKKTTWRRSSYTSVMTTGSVGPTYSPGCL